MKSRHLVDGQFSDHHLNGGIWQFGNNIRKISQIALVSPQNSDDNLAFLAGKALH